MLVLLGGGAGLAVVGLAHPRTSAWMRSHLAPGSLRGTRGQSTMPGAEAPDPAPEGPEVRVEASAPAGPPRRRQRGDVPRAFTAIEGSWHEVAVAPRWRKALSLVLLLAVLFALGIAIAVLTAAVVGLAAELVDGAVG